MASGRAKAIEEIDDIMEMSQAMAALGISFKGLKTLDQMKAKVKEELNASEVQPSWTAGQVRILQLDVIQNLDCRKKTNKHTESDGNCVGQ